MSKSSAPLSRPTPTRVACTSGTNQLCKTFAGRFKVLDEVDQLRDTDKDPDVSQLFYKLLRSRNGTPCYWMRTHLPDVIVPVLNTVVLPRLRTS